MAIAEQVPSSAMPESTALPASPDAIANLFSNAGNKLQSQHKAVVDKSNKEKPQTVNTLEPPKDIPFIDKTKSEEVQEEEVPPVQEAEGEQTEATTEQDEPIIEDKETRAWGETKKSLRQAQKELKEAKTKLAEFEQKSQELEEVKRQLKAIQDDRESIDAELYTTRVESTREYKQHVTAPLKQIEEQIGVVAKRNELDEAVLYDAIKKDAEGNPKPLEELVSDLSPREQQKAFSLSESLIAVEARKQDIKQNSKEAYEAALNLENERNQQEFKKVITAREEAVKTIFPKIDKELIANLPEDNRPDMEKLRSEVINIHQWDNDTLMYAGTAAAVLPYLSDSYKALKKELAEVKQANAKLRGASPSVSSGKPPSNTPEPSKKTDYSKVSEKVVLSEAGSRIASAWRR